jgi:hypothetical protein
MRQILHTKKTVVFPGLGRLRATKENNLFFVADEGLDIYPAGFGLEPISLKTHQETREEVTAAVAGLRSLLEEVPQPEDIQGPLPEPEIIPEPVSDPEPTEEPVSESTEEPEPTEEPISEPVGEPEPEQEQVQKSRSKLFPKILFVAACVLLLLTVTYAIVGRICPEWIDQFLYTPEELRILNHKL